MERKGQDPKVAIAEVLRVEDDPETAGSLIASRLLEMDHDLDSAEIETVAANIILAHGEDDPDSLAVRIWENLEDRLW